MLRRYSLDGRWLALGLLLVVGVALGNSADTRPTVIYMVRHAERSRVNPQDPPITAAGRLRASMLSQTLRSVPLAAIYSTELQRTRQTIKPIADRTGIQPTIIPRSNPTELVRRLQNDHAGQSVLVSGHSHSIPGLLQTLGVQEEVYLHRGDYDRLFVVIHKNGETPILVQLHYGGLAEDARRRSAARSR